MNTISKSLQALKAINKKNSSDGSKRNNRLFDNKNKSTIPPKMHHVSKKINSAFGAALLDGVEDDDDDKVSDIESILHLQGLTGSVQKELEIKATDDFIPSTNIISTTEQPTNLRRLVQIYSIFCDAQSDYEAFVELVYENGKKEDLSLEMIPNHIGAFTLEFYVPFEQIKIKGRFYLKYSSGYTIYESSRNYFGNYYRIWDIEKESGILFAVVEDEMRPFPNTIIGNDICSQRYYIDGCRRFVYAVAQDLKRTSLHDFWNIVTSRMDIRPMGGHNSSGVQKVKADDLLDYVIDTPASYDPEVFAKWVILYNRIKQINTATHLNNNSDSASLQLFQPKHVFSYIRSVEVTAVKDHICDFISSAIDTSNPDCVSWALFLLVERPMDSNAKLLISTFPLHFEICFSLFIHELPANSIIDVLKSFPSVNSLKNVCALHPDQCSDEYLEEFRAINFFLKNLELAEKITFYTDLLRRTPYFKIAGIGHISLLEIAQETVFTMLEMELGYDRIKRRVNEFVDLVRNQFPDNNYTKAALEQIYSILRTLTSYLDRDGMSLKYTITAMNMLLPTKIALPLTIRIALFAEEENLEVVKMETVALRIICCEEAEVIHNHLWRKLSTFLDLDGWKRIASLLSMTWYESYCRLKSSSLSQEEEIEILIDFMGLSEDQVLSEYVVNLLTIDKAKELHDQVSNEVKAFPQLLGEEGYARNNQICQRGKAVVQSMVEKLNNELIKYNAFEIFYNNPLLRNKLALFQPNEFKQLNMGEIYTKTQSIRSELEQVLFAYKSCMSQQPRYAECSAKLARSIQLEIATLNSKVIAEWQAPEIGGENIKSIGDRLKKAQESVVYRWVWGVQFAEQENARLLPNDEQGIVQEWIESVTSGFNAWIKFVANIQDGDCFRSDLLSALESVLQNTPSAPVDLPKDVVSAREANATYFDQMRAYLQAAVDVEVEITFDVLRDGLNAVVRNELKQTLLNFLSAILFTDLCGDVLGLARELRTPIPQECRLSVFVHSMMGKPDVAVRDVVQGYLQTISAYPQLQSIVERFPGTLCKLLKEGYEAGTFQKLLKIGQLNAKINRLIQSAEPRNQELLLSFQQTRNALSTAHDFEILCKSPVEANFQNLEILIRYLAAVSWCLGELKRLVGGVSTLDQLLFNDVGISNSMDKVRFLLIDGVFSITFPKIQLRAALPDGNGGEKVFCESDLADIPFQICLAESARTADAGIDGVVGPQQERAQYLRLSGLLTQLCDSYNKLASAGHPNYQDGILNIRGSISPVELESMIEKSVLACQRWNYFLNQSGHVLPLLSFLSRKQFVSILRMIKCRELRSLVELLENIFPFLSNASESVMLFFRTALANNADANLDSLAHHVHELLRTTIKEWIPPKSRHPLNSNAVLNQLPFFREIQRNIIIMKLSDVSSAQQSGVICSIYIAQLNRLPSAVEVMFCHKGIEEQEMQDFLSRWGSSDRVSDMLKEVGVDDNRLMFSLIHIDQLKPNVQSIVLTKISSLRRKVSTRLVLLGSFDTGNAGILPSGLRDDWITEVFVVKSSTPMSGKSTQILQDIVCTKDLPFASIPLTGDLDDMVKLLSLIERDRKLYRDESAVEVVLQFNVSNSLDCENLNRFLLGNDTVVFEWPSEGIIASTAWKNCPLIQCFNIKEPQCKFDFTRFSYQACIDDNNLFRYVLYSVKSYEDFSLKIGVQMSLAFFDALATNACILPYHNAIQNIPVPNPIELFLKFQTILSVKNMPPVAPGQMFGLYNHGLFEMWTEEQYLNDLDDPENSCQNFAILAYCLAKKSFDLAKRLAKAAIAPMSENIEDDDVRLDKLEFGFDNWKKIPFLIFHEDGSPNGTNYATGHSLENQCSVLDRCCGLSEDDRIDSTPHLEWLLSVLGRDGNFGAKQPIRSTDNLSRMNESSTLSSGLKSLRKIVGTLETLKEHVNNTISSFETEAKKWLLSIKGSHRGTSVPFILTLDNLVRLLAIKLRFACRIPVVFVGETGCGKTQLAYFHSRVSGCMLEVINVHGGMSPANLLDDIERISKKARDRNVVIILLDEVNSMTCVWTAKELLCDRMIQGRRIGNNIDFICMMNPKRQRKFLIQSFGLDYSPYASVDGPIRHQVETLPYVYEVHRSPESLMNLVWDFGSPCNSFFEDVEDDACKLTNGTVQFPPTGFPISDETIFIAHMANWMINTGLLEISDDFAACDHGENDGRNHFNFFRIFLVALISESQNFMRREFQDISAASLRDIARAVTLIPFLMTVLQRLDECGKIAERERFQYFKFLHIAVQSSLTINYALRLNADLRSKYFDSIQTVWANIRSTFTTKISLNFMPVCSEAAHIYTRSFDTLASAICNALVLDKGMALNEALKENVTSLFCSIMSDVGDGITQFIVGRPGSSKSSSLDMLCKSTDKDSTDPRTEFFKSPDWYKITKFVLQCTPDTTAYDISKLAQKAAHFQRLHKECRCVLVLEEVGVTVGSIHNPLMVLHGLVDRGVLMEDGEYVRLPIVGISNWRLDASKMNRMRTTFRGNPSVADLRLTAREIIRSHKIISSQIQRNSMAHEKEFIYKIESFADVFNDRILSNDDKELSWFYGMRDFYAFVQTLQIHRTRSLAAETDPNRNRLMTGGFDPHLIQWAIKLNFGGHPDPKIEEFLSREIFKCFFESLDVGQSANWSKYNENDKLFSINMCDMCARVTHYTDVKTARPPITDDAGRKYIFDKMFRVENSYGANCAETKSSNCFSTVRILSYCLNIQSKVSANIFRVRHVLTFTRANAALHLLFSLNIIRKEEAVTLFGRSDPSPQEALDDLLLVRRCMVSGGVLILVAANHIYESLYDALNQHYSVEGEGEDLRFFTSLTINGYTTHLPIHQSFRCIVIEQEATCRKLLPPFINRFIKVSLNFSSSLTDPQRNLTTYIRSKALARTDDEKGLVDLLGLLIPGYSKDDTIDSLSYLYPSSLLREDYEKCRDSAFLRLAYLCSPRKLLQISCGMFEKLAGQDSQQKCKSWKSAIDRKHTMSDVQSFSDSLKSVSVGSFVPAQHVFCITEQRRISFGSVASSLSNHFNDCSVLWPPTPIDLDKVTTDKEVNSIIQNLRRVETAALAKHKNVSNSNHRNTNSAGKLERFMFAVNNAELLSTKHVVIISIVNNSSIPGGPYDVIFQLHFDSLWLHIFVDEIDCFDPDDALRLDDLQPQQISTEDLLGVDNVTELLSIEVFSKVVQLQSLSLAQKICSNGTILTILEVKSLLEQVFALENCAGNFIARRIVENIGYIESCAHGQWRKMALRRVRYAESLRAHLSKFVYAIVERCILQYCTYLFPFGNVYHCLEDVKTQRLFSDLICSTVLVPDKDLSLCVQIDLPMQVTWKSNAVKDEDMFNDRNSAVVAFPFSFQLFHILRYLMISQGLDAVDRKLSEILTRSSMDDDEEIVSVTTELSEEEVLMYIHDVLFQMKLLDSFSREVAISILRAVMSDLMKEVSISKFHMILHESPSLVSSILHFLNDKDNNASELDLQLISNNDSIGAELIRVASISCGSLRLESVSAILTICGNSLHLQLAQAASLGTLLNNDEFRRQANRYVLEVSDSFQKVAQSFVDDPIAIRLSKFLLPVLFEFVPVEYKLETILQVLQGILDNFDSYPQPAVAFIVKLSLEHWLNIGDQDLLLLRSIRDYLITIPANSPQALIISRCVFDMCSECETTIEFLRKVDALDPGLLKSVFVSGAITAGIDILCSKLRSDFMNGKLDLENDQLLKILSDCIDEILSRSVDLSNSATIFALRILSSGGTEVDICRNTLALHRYLPQSVLNNDNVVDFCRPVDVNPTCLHIVQDYIEAKYIINQIKDFEVYPNIQIDRLVGLDADGVGCALLETGFCDYDLSQKDQLLRIGNIVLKAGNLKKFLDSLMFKQEVQQVFHSWSADLKRFWVAICVTSLSTGGVVPLMNFLGRIVSGPFREIISFAAQQNQILPLSTHIKRFLFSALMLGSIVQTPLPNVNAAEIQRHANEINDMILTTRCPGAECGHAMDFWDGCFSVTCKNCNACFCGWCFTLCGNDAHPHLLVCGVNPNPGSYWGTEAQYRDIRKRQKQKALNEYFSNLANDVKQAVLEEVAQNMIDIGIDPSSIILQGGLNRYSIASCKMQIDLAVSRIKSEYFPASATEDPPLLYLQGFYFNHVLKVPRACGSDEVACQILDDLFRESSVENPPSIISKLQALIDDACKRQTSNINHIVAWDATYEEFVSKLPINIAVNRLPNHFAFRTRVTLEMFWDHVERTEELSLLAFFHKHAQSLEKKRLNQLVYLLNFIGDVVHICKVRQLTREQAQTMSLDQLLAESEQLFVSRKIDLERVTKFFRILRIVYNFIERFECKVKFKEPDGLEHEYGPIFQDMPFDQSIRLIYLLPTSSNEGLLMNIIYKGASLDGDTWRSIVINQRDVVSTIANHFNIKKPRDASNLPYGISINDLVVYSEERDVFDNLSLYIEPTSSASLSPDLSTLQTLVIRRSSMWDKVLVAESLPEFQFSDETRNRSLFGDFMTRIGCDYSLKPDIHRMISSFAKLEPHFAVCCIEYLTVCCLDLVKLPDANIPDKLVNVAKVIATQLTVEQEQGQKYLSSLQLARELQTRHIVTIVAVLWDGAVIEDVRVPVDDEQLLNEFERCLVELKNDRTRDHIKSQLVMAFRLLGVCEYCTLQDLMKLNAPLNVVLEAYLTEDSELDLDMLQGLGLTDEVKSAYYYEFYNLMLKVLDDGFNEEEYAATSSEGMDFDVSLVSFKDLYREENVAVPQKEDDNQNNGVNNNNRWEEGRGGGDKERARNGREQKADLPNRKAQRVEDASIRWEGRGLLIPEEDD
eukprot:gene4257-6036_t